MSQKTCRAKSRSSPARPRGSARPSPSTWPPRGRRWSSTTPPARKGPSASSAEITGKGGRAIAVGADVTKPADIKRLFAETKKAFGRLDILVNNAGIYEFAPLEAVTPEHFHKQFDLNVLGLILARRRRRSSTSAATGGSIINISSVVSTSAPANDLGLQRDQGGRRRRDPVAGQGAGPAQDPRQLDQPRHGRDRRHDIRRDHRQRERLPQAGRIANAARPDRPAAATSLPPPSSSRRPIPPGSPAKRSTSRAGVDRLPAVTSTSQTRRAHAAAAMQWLRQKRRSGR